MNCELRPVVIVSYVTQDKPDERNKRCLFTLENITNNIQYLVLFQQKNNLFDAINQIPSQRL